METKIYVDTNLDEVREGVQKEYDSVMLKLKWTNDEKRTVFADLDEALRILEDKGKFIEAQKEDIQTLLE